MPQGSGQKSKKYRDRANSPLRKTGTRFLYSVLNYNFLRNSSWGKILPIEIRFLSKSWMLLVYC